jgi:hypothetical protein
MGLRNRVDSSLAIPTLQSTGSDCGGAIVLGEEVEQLIADEGVDELDQRQEQLAALEGCLERLPQERKRLILDVYSGERSMKALQTPLERHLSRSTKCSVDYVANS